MMNKKQIALMLFLSIPVFLTLLNYVAAALGFTQISNFISSPEVAFILTVGFIFVNIFCLSVVAVCMRLIGYIEDKGVTLKSLEEDEHRRVEEARG